MLDSLTSWTALADFGGTATDASERRRTIAIVGAPKTGKSILAISFIHSQRQHVQSFSRLLTFNFSSPPIEHEYQLRQAIREGVASGLAGASTAGGDADSSDPAAILDERPPLPLTLQFGFSHAESGRFSGRQSLGPGVEMTPISIRDCPGSLLAAGASSDQDLMQARHTAVRQVCQESDAIILCLPLSGPKLDVHRNSVLRFIGDLTSSLGRDGGSGKRLILALTKSELAISRARTRSQPPIAQGKAPTSTPGRIGWDIFGNALDEPLRGSLEILQDQTKIEIWATPVSAYGFVGPNSAPNVYTRKSGEQAGEELLLVSPAALSQIQQDLGLASEDVGDIDIERCLTAWMPYRIADPIIMASLEQNRLEWLMHEMQDETMIVRLRDFLAERR